MSISIKSQLAPKGLQFNPVDFNISDKYATILSVISYPRFIAPGYLSTLTSMSGIKIVIKHIPVPFSTMSKMINRQVADLREKYRQEHDQTAKERIRQDAESLESFVSMLASSQSRIFDFQMHIMINADTREELELKKVNVKNYLDAMELRAVSLRFEQEKVLKSILPIFPNQDIEERIGTPIPSPTIAAMYPFIFDSIKDPGLSVLLGVDFSGGVILFNQFLYQIRKENNRNNANMIILGTSGSGKSTAAKLLLRTHIRNGCQIVAIDPENELEEMTKTFGGDTIDIGKGGEYGLINPLEIIIDADDEQIKKGVTDYLQQNKETLTFMPTVEELNQIDEQLRTSRDNKIQMREFQKQEEIQNMADSVRRFMDAAERDGKTLGAQDVDKYIKETFADSAYIQDALEAGKKEVQRREEERLIREEAAKNFDKVVNEEFDKFLNNPRNTGVHGVNYFSSVGRSRRTEGYRSIAYATGKRLKLLHGSYDDVSHYTHPDYAEFINLTNKVRDVEENRPVIDVNDYIVNPDTYSSYTEEQELEDNPIELTPEEKEARKQMLKSAKAAAKKDMSAKGQKTKQTTTIKGGLAGLAALLSEREK